MLTFTPEIVVALQTRIRLQDDSKEGPYCLPGIAHRKVPVSNELAKDGTDLHCRRCVILLCQHLEMPGIDTPTLFEKISYSERPFVIDDTGRLIDQFEAKL